MFYDRQNSFPSVCMLGPCSPHADLVAALVPQKRRVRRVCSVREVFDTGYCFNKVRVLLAMTMDECLLPLHSTASGKGELTVCQTSYAWGIVGDLGRFTVIKHKQTE